jgi:hypothetical protein
LPSAFRSYVYVSTDALDLDFSTRRLIRFDANFCRDLIYYSYFTKFDHLEWLWEVHSVLSIAPRYICHLSAAIVSRTFHLEVKFND